MQLKEIFKNFLTDLKRTKNESELNETKSKYLGRNGLINNQFKKLKN